MISKIYSEKWDSMKSKANKEKRFSQKRLRYHLGYSAISIIAIIVVLKILNASLKIDLYTMGKIFGTLIVYCFVLSFFFQIIKLKNDKIIIAIIVIALLPVIAPEESKQMPVIINKSVTIPVIFLWNKIITDIKRCSPSDNSDTFD